MCERERERVCFKGKLPTEMEEVGGEAGGSGRGGAGTSTGFSALIASQSPDPSDVPPSYAGLGLEKYQFRVCNGLSWLYHSYGEMCFWEEELDGGEDEATLWISLSQREKRVTDFDRKERD